MNDRQDSSNRKRQIPITYMQSGETKLVDAPLTKLVKEQEQIPGEVEGTQSAAVTDGLSTPEHFESSVKTIPVTSHRKRGKKEGMLEKKKIESCDEYLEEYYSGRLKSLSEKTVHLIKGKAPSTTGRRASLIDHAVKSDFALEKTRSLFVFSLNAGGYSGLGRTLRDFAKDVVMRHPVMGSEDSAQWFPIASHNDAANVKSLWTDVGIFDPETLPETSTEDEPGKKTSSADIRKARRNAFLCAVIWRFAERQATFAEFFRSLRSTIFQSAPDDKEVEEKLLNFLVLSQEKDRPGIAAFAQWFHDQTLQAQKQAEQHKQRLDSLQLQKQELDDLLLAKEDEIVLLNEQLSTLQLQVDASVEEIRILKVHSKDDLERQKSRTLRTLEDEIPVLADCLTALNRDPPKVEVAKEYLGTALDTLNRELKALGEK